MASSSRVSMGNQARCGRTVAIAILGLPWPLIKKPHSVILRSAQHCIANTDLVAGRVRIQTAMSAGPRCEHSRNRLMDNVFRHSAQDQMLAYIVHDATRIDDLRCENLPLPELGDGDVMVRIHAVSINYRDLLVVRGVPGWRPPGPRIICSDAAGVVMAVGRGVTRLVVGDRVASTFLADWDDGPLTDSKTSGGPGGQNHDGMLAQFRVLPERAFLRIPDYLTFVEAATLPCAAVTAWNAVIEQAPLLPGRRVIVIGAGGVSVFALKFARLAGAEVVAVTRRAAHADALRALGAHHVVLAPDLARAADQIDALGLNGDLVVDVVGGDVRPQSRMLRRGGRLCLIGVVNGFQVQLEVASMPERVDTLSVGSRSMFDRMLAAMTLHETRPEIDRVFTFDQAHEAFRHFESARNVGKVVIEIWPESQEF